MKIISYILLAALVLFVGYARASTSVPLQQAPLSGWRSVSCNATSWDAQGINPMGACQYTGVASGSGRGGGYVKPPLAWYAAAWDLFGNLTLGPKCASRAKWVSTKPPIIYEAGYSADNCNSTVINQGVEFQGTTYWIGPSLAGEYVLIGRTLYLP